MQKQLIKYTGIDAIRKIAFLKSIPQCYLKFGADKVDGER